MHTFVYLHGFNSAFNHESDKVQLLQNLGHTLGITYDTFLGYEEIRGSLKSRVGYLDNPVFVGTSLGGYWAAKMGEELFAPSVIINPCWDPHSALKKYVGIPQTNYVTGEKDILSPTVPASYVYKHLSGKRNVYLNPLVLLDEGDEVISSKETAKQLRGYPMISFPGGNHRFVHMEEALPRITEYLNHCALAGITNEV
ncbi:MAG: YqiA/YcfP family alpha/beta fold hydrolase [Anaerolineaceae bacterium]